MITFKQSIDKMTNILYGCILLIGTCVSVTNPVSVPFIIKCKADDNACIKQNAIDNVARFAAGLPDYNVEPLDPLILKRVDASTNNLKLILSNLYIKGLKNCDIITVGFDEATHKSSLNVDILCSLRLEGDYEMKGKLLFLTIEGHGKTHSLINKILAHVVLNVEEYIRKDGKKHWKISSFTHSFELKDKSEVVFEDLFKGNTILSRATEDLIKNSGNDVVYEVGSPVVQAGIEKIAENIAELFKKTPIEDLQLI